MLIAYTSVNLSSLDTDLEVDILIPEHTGFLVIRTGDAKMQLLAHELTPSVALQRPGSHFTDSCTTVQKR